MSVPITPRQPEPLDLENLSALVVRLARALKKAQPGHPLPGQAVAYLQRKGLVGSPLRDVKEDPEASVSISRAP